MTLIVETQLEHLPRVLFPPHPFIDNSKQTGRRREFVFVPNTLNGGTSESVVHNKG